MPEQSDATRHPAAPVNFIPGDPTAGKPEPGTALRLSGGGYHAMVFHLGALLRLNETGDWPLANPNDDHDGAYWGIRAHIDDYSLTDALLCPAERTMLLAQTPTCLKPLEPDGQERLINWGYAVCDAALCKHANPQLKRPADFPYPARGV